MPKRIVIITMGTTGDVNPCISLALSLKSRGHSVLLAGPSDFKENAESLGIEYQDLGSSVRSFMTQAKTEKFMSHNALLELPTLANQCLEMTSTASYRAWKASRGADLIIFNLYATFGIDIAEALKIPCVAATFQPLSTTNEYSLCIYGGVDLGKVANRLSYLPLSFQQGLANLVRRKTRKTMGLGALRNGTFLHDNRGEKITTLCAFSEILSPRPHDWSEKDIITGFWKHADPSGWQPSEEFKKFLSEGDLPVYIGFGSMTFGAERSTQIIRDAMKAWGGRAVVARGWGGIRTEDLPENVFSIEKAPHDKLFQYVRAVVHHGGAGTTSSGLRLGLPTLVIPQTADQPFWGRRVHETGCGPKPIHIKKLDANTLAAALQDLTTNVSYKHSAMNLAKKLSQEKGADKASEVIESILAKITAERAA